MGCSEHGNESSGSVKVKECLIQLSHCQVLKKESGKSKLRQHHHINNLWNNHCVEFHLHLTWVKLI